MRIHTKPYYAPGLHDPSWEHRFDSGYGPAEWTNLSVTTGLTETVLALPMSSELSESQVDRLKEALELVLRSIEVAA
jgi:dTDP-4-amino-4,6-dideoxygalactose transaminase